MSCVLIHGTPVLHAVVAGVTYIVVLGIWSRLLVRGATDPAAWRESMRRRQRTYAGTAKLPTLEAALKAAGRRLTILELGTAGVPVAVASVIAARLDPSVVKSVPFGVAVVACTVFAVELGRVFVNGFRFPLSGGKSSAAHEDDVGESLTSSTQETARRLMKKLGYAALVIAALRGISDLLGVWDVIKQIYNWIAHTLL